VLFGSDIQQHNIKAHSAEETLPKDVNA